MLTLFNIYTNDQPISPSTKHFIYVDEIAIALNATPLKKTEEHLTTALDNLPIYYIENQLKPNVIKTILYASHLKNWQAARGIQIKWERTNLNHTKFSKYFGLFLDKSLTYKKHYENTKAK